MYSFTKNTSVAHEHSLDIATLVTAWSVLADAFRIRKTWVHPNTVNKSKKFKLQCILCSVTSFWNIDFLRSLICRPSTLWPVNGRPAGPGGCSAMLSRDHVCESLVEYWSEICQQVLCYYIEKVTILLGFYHPLLRSCDIAWPTVGLHC